MTKDEALERKAENARELGLNYEPEQKVDWEKLYWLEVKKKEAIAAKYERDIKPLTKIVPMAQPEREPVTLDVSGLTGSTLIPANWNSCVPSKATTASQQTWICLTDEEIAKEFYKFEAAGAWYQFARAIEASVQEKNI